jgi:hypothetical protein
VGHGKPRVALQGSLDFRYGAVFQPLPDQKLSEHKIGDGAVRGHGEHVREGLASLVPALRHDVATCQQICAIGAVRRKLRPQLFQQRDGCSVLSHRKIAESEELRRFRIGIVLQQSNLEMRNRLLKLVGLKICFAEFGFNARGGWRRGGKFVQKNQRILGLACT